MTTQEVKRKLTAILSADVKGYSRLMNEDEVGTVRTLNVYKEMQIYGPDHLLAHVGLAVTYALMDREKDARAEGAQVLRIDPKFSWERWMKGLPYDQSLKDRWADALRKVGLK